YARWMEANPGERGKSILAEQGYYYAWGASARVTAELATSRFGLGASAFRGSYKSQQGFDRAQPELTVDQIARDRYADLSVWIRGRLFDNVFVEYRRDAHQRASDIDGIEGSGRLLRRSIELGTYF